MTLASILIVDDERVIREVLSERLSEVGHTCTVAPNAFDALKEIAAKAFDVILCDIDMPGKDGISLLQEVKGTHPETDVVMVTGVVDTDTAIRAIRLGASDYLTKPFNLEEVVITVDRILDKQRLIRENRDYQVGLEQKVQERTQQLEDAYRVTLEALVAALDIRDTETQDHSIRVARFTYVLAEKMGVTQPALSQIHWGALLHDIGKIGIPDAILRKPGKLTEDEWKVMRLHPEKGYRILENIEFLAEAREIVLHHQERWDGTGYPTGKAGENIPVGARIFTVADTFDAMTSDRPYRKRLPYGRARQELLEYSGRQFDPRVVECFCSIPESFWEEERRRILAESSSNPQARAVLTSGYGG